MLRSLKDFIRNILQPLAIPLGYFGALWLFATTIVTRAQLGMYVLIGVIPLPTIYYQFHPYPFGKDFIDILYLSVAVGISVHKGGFDRTRCGRMLVTFVIANYISLCLASMNFGLPFPITTENHLLPDWKNYAEMICLYFLAHNSLKTEDHQKMAVLVLGTVMLLICLREFRNFSQGGAFSYDKRVEGPFWIVGLGANHMGAFVAHYCAALLGLVLVDPNKLRRRVFIAAMLFGLHPLFFSYSRGAYMGLLAAIVFFGIVKRRSLLVLVAALAIAWQTILPTTVVERITMTEEASGQLEASSAKRIELWEHAVSVFKANPVIGVGFGGFGHTIPSGAFEGLTDTHNFYLRMLSEQGIVGITFFIVILLTAWRSGWLLFRRGRTEFHQGLGLGFMGCVVAATVTNMFGDRWSYLVLGSNFFVLWGLVDRGNQLSETAPAPSMPASAPVGASPVVVPAQSRSGEPAHGGFNV